MGSSKSKPPKPAGGTGRPSLFLHRPYTTARAKIALPICGVHVKFLRSLARDHADLVDKDIGYIVQNYVKPLTKTLSFADFAQGDPELKSLVKSKADYFVSYAWKYTLGTVVSALADYEDSFVWMDFLVVNQNQGQAPISPNDLKEMLGSAIKEIGHALVIVSPWDQPINTQRIWCVFELFMTEQLGISVELLFAGEDKERFKQTMATGAIPSTFHGIFGNVNVSKAQATVQKDREAIMKLVQDYGEVRVNNVVMLGLKDWLVKSALDFGFTNDTDEGINVMNSLGALYLALGNLDDAQVYLGRALKCSKTVFHTESSGYATLLNNLAECLRAQGKLDEAEPLYQEAIKIWKHVLGPDDPNVATGLNNLAECLRVQGKVDEAEPLYRETIAIFKRFFDADHPNVATALNNLASCHLAQGKLNEAEPLYREAMDIDIRALGRDHPDVAIDFNNLAGCLRAQGKLNEAEALFRESLAIRKRALGAEHPSVASALNNLAGLLRSQGKETEAKKTGHEALQIIERALGPNHPTTKSYREWWGS